MEAQAEAMSMEAGSGSGRRNSRFHIPAMRTMTFHFKVAQANARKVFCAASALAVILLVNANRQSVACRVFCTIGRYQKIDIGHVIPYWGYEVTFTFQQFCKSHYK